MWRSPTSEGWAAAPARVDRITLALAARHGIGVAFAFDADLASDGLRLVTAEA